MAVGYSQEIKDLLEFKYIEYNKRSFIDFDPISIPYEFSKKEDIEIVSFLISTISWGNRKSIINSIYLRPFSLANLNSSFQYPNG